jgi:hypothetical protein
VIKIVKLYLLWTPGGSPRGDCRVALSILFGIELESCPVDDIVINKIADLSQPRVLGTCSEHGDVVCMVRLCKGLLTFVFFADIATAGAGAPAPSQKV